MFSWSCARVSDFYLNLCCYLAPMNKAMHGFRDHSGEQPSQLTWHERLSLLIHLRDQSFLVQDPFCSLYMLWEHSGLATASTSTTSLEEAYQILSSRTQELLISSQSVQGMDRGGGLVQSFCGLAESTTILDCLVRLCLTSPISFN